jgi:hypothetical protein
MSPGSTALCKMRQQAVKQATVDVDHVAPEVACQMDDGIQRRKRW